MKLTRLISAAAIIVFLMSSFVFAQDTTLTVTSAGNVGIGTTSPTDLLSVSGGRLSVDRNLLLVNLSATWTGETMRLFDEDSQLALYSQDTQALDKECSCVIKFFKKRLFFRGAESKDRIDSKQRFRTVRSESRP